MRSFKTKPFARFARREGIGDSALRDAVERIASGLVDADLGGGVIKQRIARPGQGRSGGVRALAGEMIGLDEAGIEAMLANGTISEVNSDG